MNQFRRLIHHFLVALCLILSVCTAVSAAETDDASAQAEVLTGQCGENAYYSFDGTTLTISGTGAIWDNAEYTCRWSYAEFIGMKHIVIEEGITEIGKSSFNKVGIPNCTLSLPNSLEKIGEAAFQLSGVTHVVLPEKITVIPGFAFWGSSLETIETRGVVTEIGEQAFGGCGFMTQATFKGASAGINLLSSTTALEIVLPYEIEKIHAGAFSNCYQLSKITIQNPNCQINTTVNSTLGVPGVTVVVSFEDSAAHKYAKQYGYTFESFPKTCQYGYHQLDIIVTVPTCEDPGYTSAKCKNCDYVLVSDWVDAAGHKYKEEVVAPTLTEEGYTRYTCNICGHSYKDNFVPPHTHNYEDTVVDPTCTKDGYTVHYCPECGYSFEDSQTEATGHTWGKWISLGNKQWERSCQVCLEKEEGVGAYIITSGRGSWLQGSEKTYTLYVEADLNDLLSVSVDGSKIPGTAFAYTADLSGITLTVEYLKTLTPGEHRIVLFFPDGEGETVLTVVAQEQDETEPSTSPNDPQTTPSVPQQTPTGPSGPPIVLWIVLGVILCTAVGVGLYIYLDRFGNPFAK